MTIPGDCSKCLGGDCTAKESCFRFVAVSGNPNWQAFFTTPPGKGADCEFYWPIKEERSDAQD